MVKTLIKVGYLPYLKLMLHLMFSVWEITTYLGCCSCGMINLKELCLISGKAAWMAYLVITWKLGKFIGVSAYGNLF